MDLIKISPDKERAKNIVSMTSLVVERIKLQDKEREKMSALMVADYYEIIKELITAVMFTDGYKTLSHKDVIEYLKERYKEFNGKEIVLLDDLRVLRNRISYDGFNIDRSYLDRNEENFKNMIKKLNKILNKRLK
jgi:hypothetical protein